jgi:MurNAc alpha-1-phosphate uridylyltransferase
MDAILLAAGLGTRMRPLTETTPKPLLPLGGRALLDRALDRLADAGAARVVVNAHWHAGQLRAHLAARAQAPATLLREEACLLDTGGAVLAALDDAILGTDDTPFFVINSDSVWLDGPRPALGRMRSALRDGVDGVLLVHRTFQVQAETLFGDFFLDPWGIPRRRKEREIAPYLYAGITLARPALFAAWRGKAANMSMNPIWDHAMLAGRLVALVHDGLWFHLSTPRDLQEAEDALMAQTTGQTT